MADPGPAPTPAPGPGATVEATAVALVRALRARGVAAPPDATLAYVTALAELGVARRAGAYWAGRATLVHRPEDIAVYDEVFARLVEGRWGPADPTAARAERPAVVAVGIDGGEPGRAEPEPAPGPVVPVRWSDHEVLRDKDLAACTPDERAEVHRLVADLRVTGEQRRSRRLRPTRRARGTLDLRATAHASLGTGGEPLRARYRAPGERHRRLVLICDISGSMDVYSRALVRFAHAAVTGRTQVEVFTLGTRCTRITRALRTHDPDVALTAAADVVTDWSGGTRLGAGLRAFNDEWGQRGTARGAVVVVLSDGWDRGDPELLAEQTRRLRRAAHRLVWVNPLKASPGFAPVARGMAAALPHVDELVEGHSLRSLEDLTEVIGR